MNKIQINELCILGTITFNPTEKGCLFNRPDSPLYLHKTKIKMQRKFLRKI